MRLTLAACLALAVLACKDPNSFQPFDPDMPDPPAPPVLIYPVHGWVSDFYGYPQSVNFGWQKVSGAQFYQIEVYRDSLLRREDLVFGEQRAAQSPVGTSFSTYGWYFWRVRAASRNWNNYTDWSTTFRFGLPNPAR